MAWHELTLSSSETLFTTAPLRWRPLAEDDPDGAQIATLWGDPSGGDFGAIVRSARDPDTYTLIRRESSDDGALPDRSAIGPAMQLVDRPLS
jgi:hypothetical protein